jgi:hypothetical protein
MNARTPAVVVVVALCAVVGTLMLACGAAQGADRHNYLSQFDEVPALGPHGETVPVPGPIVAADAMTIDSGEVYVADHVYLETGRPTYRIDRFNAATGAFIAQFPRPAGSVTYAVDGIAVGHSGGQTYVYVSASEADEGATARVVAVYNQAGTLQKVWRGAEALSKGFSCCQQADVAVDDSPGLGDWAAGDVYVTDQGNNVVDVYEPETGSGEKKPVAELKGVSPSEPFQAPYQVAVSTVNGDVTVADGSGIHLFQPAAIQGQYELLATLARPDGSAFTNQVVISANDGEGDIYVLPRNEHQIFEFNAAGEYQGRVTSETAPKGWWGGEYAEPVAITSDPETHQLYVGTYDQGNLPAPVFVFGPNVVLPDVATVAASNLKPESATLNGTVDLDKAGAATCQFEWGTSTALGEVAPCSARVEAEGKVPVSANIGHLQPGSTYYYRLQASNANGSNDESQVRQLTTLGPRLVEASASDVASTSATLNATIDPEGDATSYYFQYGLSSAYGAEIPAAPGAALGAGTSGVSASNHVQGLTPGVVYHYRVVMVSEVEVEPSVVERLEFPGQDETFTTQIAGSGLVLPDGRQWEMVSPPDKHGSTIEGIREGAMQASSSGEMMTYITSLPTEGEATGNSSGEGTQVFSRRGATGWSSRDIMLPHATPTGPSVDHGGEYRMFSEDLSLGLVEPFGAYTSLGDEASPPDTGSTLYLRHDLTCEAAPAGCYETLVTSAPGYADEPPGTLLEAITFAGATPDLTHVLLSAKNESLYEWSMEAAPRERLQPVTVFPKSEGGELTTGRLGAGYGEHTLHAIASDGSRVVWTGTAGTPGLYLRDLAKQETVRLDTVQGGSGRGLPEAHFESANSEDSRVFFTDTQFLTEDSNAVSGKPDLYECEIGETSSGLDCTLRDLTPGTGGRSAGVQGVVGNSADGGTLYFVATGVLTSTANSRDEKAVDGADNLYMLHYDSGSGKWEGPSLIGVLSSEDAPDWRSEPAHQPTKVSSDGRYLTFMSNQPLTGYDNHDASSGKADEEVFLLDAKTNRLVCASCNPSGALPHGVEDNPNGLNRLVDANSVWQENTWLAANVPSWTPYEGGAASYQSRYLSNEGRLFFDSSDALVPQDINGNEDVYEYEPPGVGTCTASSLTFSERSGGCVSLISSGTSSAESAFVDAGETGDDAFFMTTEKLLPQDIDSSYDIYDAHACSGSAPCFDVPVSAPACVTAESCRAAPTPQPAAFGAPASETFSGAGNVPPSTSGPTVRMKVLTKAQQLTSALATCHKRYRSRKGKQAACERQARKRYGGAAPRKAKKKSTKKRGGR